MHLISDPATSANTIDSNFPENKINYMGILEDGDEIDQ